MILKRIKEGSDCILACLFDAGAFWATGVMVYFIIMVTRINDYNLDVDVAKQNQSRELITTMIFT